VAEHGEPSVGHEAQRRSAVRLAVVLAALAIVIYAFGVVWRL